VWVRRGGKRIGKWPAVLVMAASLLASCSGGARSIRLALSLTPGMERTMRIEVNERFGGASPSRAWGAREKESAAPPSFATSMTYRFRVLSVDQDGIATIRCEVVEATASSRFARRDELLESLEGQSSLLFLDRAGRVRAAEPRRPLASGLPGFPLPPGSLPSPDPALGDLQALLGGVNGRVVSLGETWSSTAHSAQAGGLEGTLCWTVESITGEGIRLGFSGTIEERQIAHPRLTAGESALLSGNISGFVVLEAATGWPLQGKTVVKIDAIRRAAETPVHRGRPLFSLTAVTLFDPAR